MKKLKNTYFAAFVVLLSPMASHAAPELDQFQLNGSEQGQAIFSEKTVGQTITVGTAGFLDSIELSLLEQGSGGNLVVTILDMNGGDLSLAPSLGSVSIFENAIGAAPLILSPTSVTATLIDLSSLRIFVNIGDVLAIELSTSRVLPSLYAIRTAIFSDLYAGGAYYVGTNFLVGDAAFKTFITPFPPAQAGNQFVRVIKLFPTTGARFDKARGQFRIFQITAAGFSNAIYSVQGLPDLQRSRAYAVYATTPSLGRLRVQMFNTVPSFQTITSFTSMPDLFNPAWLEDDVTIEVYIEEDDGFDAPNVGGLLVLSGFSAGTP